MPMWIFLYMLVIVFTAILFAVTVKGIKYTVQLFREARDLDRASFPAITVFVLFSALALVAVWVVLIGLLVLPWIVE